MAEQQNANAWSLMLNYMMFAALGIACSLLFNSYYGNNGDSISQQLRMVSILTQDTEYPMKGVASILEGTDCEEVQKEAKIASTLRDFMGTKLRYQFDSAVVNSSAIGHCRAIKVSE